MTVHGITHFSPARRVSSMPFDAGQYLPAFAVKMPMNGCTQQTICAMPSMPDPTLSKISHVGRWTGITQCSPGLSQNLAAIARLASGWDTFIMDGLGTRCVSDEPWVTASETAETLLPSQRLEMSTPPLNFSHGLEVTAETMVPTGPASFIPIASCFPMASTRRIPQRLLCLQPTASANHHLRVHCSDLTLANPSISERPKPNRAIAVHSLVTRALDSTFARTVISVYAWISFAVLLIGLVPIAHR